MAAALGKAAGKGSVPKTTILDGRTEASLKLDILVVKAFKRAGYGEVTPRQDVMTYNKWLASGWKVKSGEKAVKCRQFRLFHKSQVEFVGIPPKEAAPSEAEVRCWPAECRTAQCPPQCVATIIAITTKGGS